MYQILKHNKETVKYFSIFTLVILIFLLVTVVYKNDEDIVNKSKDFSFEDKNFTIIKEFLLKKVNSPFINVNYEIKKGDSIQKILKKFKIQNNEIQKIISQYKKYSNPSKLLTGDKIEIVAKKGLAEKKNYIVEVIIPASE